MVLARLKESIDLAPTCAWPTRLSGEFNKGTVVPTSSSVHRENCPDLSLFSPLPEVN